MEESPQSRNEHNAIQTHTSGYLYGDIARLNILEHVWDMALAYRPPCPCVGNSIGKPQIAVCCLALSEFLQGKVLVEVTERNNCVSIPAGSLLKGRRVFLQ
jgi:hypothetical protein